MTMPRRLRAAAALAAPALLATAALTVPVAPAAAQAAPAGCTGGTKTGTWVNVVASGLRSGDGLLAITVYADDSRKFLKSKGSLYVARVDAQSGTTRACVFLPKTGVYSLALYHDENGNRKFDRNPLPKEGFGFSNNPPTLLSVPTFSSTRISIPRNNMTVRVAMRYP